MTGYEEAPITSLGGLQGILEEDLGCRVFYCGRGQDFHFEGVELGFSFFFSFFGGGGDGTGKGRREGSGEKKEKRYNLLIASIKGITGNWNKQKSLYQCISPF